MIDVTHAAKRLLNTLTETEYEIRRLAGFLSDQVTALRERRADALERSTDDVGSASHTLRELLASKTKQTECLAACLHFPEGSVDLSALIGQLAVAEPDLAANLTSVRDEIRMQIEQTHLLYEDLSFALNFAASLNAELFMAVVDQAVGDEPVTYSATGDPGRHRSGGRLLNKVA